VRPTAAGVLRAVLLVVAAMVAVTVGTRSAVPVPDLVLPVVVAGGLLGGPARGGLLGLAGGWLVDLVPPGATVLGTSALLYAACGLLAGAGRREGVAPWGWVVVVGAASAVLASAGRVALALVTSAPVDLVAVGTGLALTLAWSALTLPLLIGAEQRLRRGRRA
jgi:rod shape-determining protein MreD